MVVYGPVAGWTAGSGAAPQASRAASLAALLINGHSIGPRAARRGAHSRMKTDQNAPETTQITRLIDQVRPESGARSKYKCRLARLLRLGTAGRGALAAITIVAGLLVFVGRICSPVLRRMEPAWTFFKPLILLALFVTGFLAMHPTWSPVDYHVIRLVHIVSACAAFVLVPFARLLTYLHTPLTQVFPETAWAARGTGDAGPTDPGPITVMP